MGELDQFNFKHEGITIRHQETSMPAIIDILKVKKIEVLVELGTFMGGFALYLNQKLPDLEIHTLDMAKWVPDEVLDKFTKKVTYYNSDVLKDTEPVRLILEKYKKTMLYCDNGDKPEEVRLYADFLKTGDILGVHDWGIEIGIIEIKDIVTNEKFRPVELGAFMDNGWVSRFWERLPGMDKKKKDRGRSET